MIKLYVSTFVLLLFFHFSNAQYYVQYFEGADTSIHNSVIVEIDPDTANIWQIGEPNKIIFDSAATVPNAIVTDTINNYPVNNTSRFIIRILNDFTPWGIFALQWMQKLDLDTIEDGGYVEFSIDHGLTWENAFNNPYVYNFYGYQSENVDTLSNGDFVFTGKDTTWANIWLCFDLSWMSTFPDTIIFRFTLKSDYIDNANEGWLIDNFIAQYTWIHTIKKQEPTGYLNVYPNPSNGIIKIETEKLNQFHIIEHMELVDMKGRIVEQWKNIPTKFWFDSTKYSDGLYLLNVKTNLQSETIPVMISKN